MKSDSLLVGVLLLLVLLAIASLCQNYQEDFRGWHRGRWRRPWWGRRYYSYQPYGWSWWPWGGYTPYGYYYY
jgi:hypothetical protein